MMLSTIRWSTSIFARSCSVTGGAGCAGVSAPLFFLRREFDLDGGRTEELCFLLIAVVRWSMLSGSLLPSSALPSPAPCRSDNFVVVARTSLSSSGKSAASAVSASLCCFSRALIGTLLSSSSTSRIDVEKRSTESIFSACDDAVVSRVFLVVERAEDRLERFPRPVDGALLLFSVMRRIEFGDGDAVTTGTTGCVGVWRLAALPGRPASSKLLSFPPSLSSSSLSSLLLAAAAATGGCRMRRSDDDDPAGGRALPLRFVLRFVSIFSFSASLSSPSTSFLPSSSETNASKSSMSPYRSRSSLFLPPLPLPPRVVDLRVDTDGDGVISSRLCRSCC
eukprot:PhM_4_TR11506/c0_g1_i1/m.97090